MIIGNCESIMSFAVCLHETIFPLYVVQFFELFAYTL